MSDNGEAVIEGINVANVAGSGVTLGRDLTARGCAADTGGSKALRTES